MTFKVRHLGARDYRAGFREIDATLDAGAGTLVASVPVATLDLNNPVIRERMLSDEFLDAARFPEVTLERGGDRRRRDARDHRDGRALDPRPQPHGRGDGRIGLPGPGLLSPENRVGIELSAVVDRRDFGLDWQERLPTGGDTLGWDVTLEAILEFVEQE